MRHKRLKYIIPLFLFLMGWIIKGCVDNEMDGKEADNTYVGDKECASCHQGEFNDWKTSHHYMAMLPASDSSVSGDFNDVTLTADGVTSRFFRKGDKFIINTQGEDGKNHDYEVKYTFGFTPLQQYLVEFPGGRMQVPRVSWDVKNKKWFHQYAGQEIPAHDWLHWTGNSQNWNTMCASCHSTNLKKNYDPESDSYHTTYDVMNVSCESCHGPGKMHIDYINSKKYKKNKTSKGSYIALNKKSGQTEQINTCAPCHARVTHLGGNPDPHGDIMDNYIPEIPSNEHFYPDGQVNDEDYIYTSFLQSKMYHRGIKCTDCHNPHSGKKVAEGNKLCLNCHAPKYDDPAHTFHQTGTEGNKCVSCHMPGKVFMGNDLRHDHSFRVPRPDLSAKFGTPNACNLCHTDKSAKWAADAIVKWYGPERKPHFSERLIPGSLLDNQSEANLLSLLQDDSVPAIVQATSAHYLGNILSGNSLNALLKCLNHADPQVRYRALTSLAGFPASSWMYEVGELLSDKVRAVRIGAANLYVAIPAAEVPEQYRSAFQIAKQELESYLFYQADFSVGNVSLGDYYMKQGDYSNAEKYYLRGLRMDNLMNYARFNLSTAYNLMGRNMDAIKTLKEIEKIDPGNDRVQYNLALIYNEINNKAEAEKAFEKAVQLRSENPRVYYNFGLLLNEKKAYVKAAVMLKKGLEINPQNPELWYVLALVHLNNNDPVNAKMAAVKLKSLAPANSDYAALYKQFGI